MSYGYGENPMTYEEWKNRPRPDLGTYKTLKEMTDDEIKAEVARLRDEGKIAPIVVNLNPID